MDLYKMTAEDYKFVIHKAFENAEKGISKCSEDILKMDGMTGKRTRHLYNNLLNIPNARYLEVGVYTGSSLCACIYNNSIKYAYAIDNWSQFGGPKQQFLENIEKFKGQTPVTFIESDFEKVDCSKLPKFNVYLFDGGHSFQDHMNALIIPMECLDDIFIYIVDDWNWITVRKATLSAIENCQYKILHGVELKTTPDDSHPSGELCTEYYWNGVCVFLLQKPSQL